MAAIEPEPDELLELMVRDLTERFPHIEPDHVAEVTTAAFTAIAEHSKAPGFVGILAEREAVKELTADETPTADRPDQ